MIQKDMCTEHRYHLEVLDRHELLYLCVSEKFVKCSNRNTNKHCSLYLISSLWGSNIAIYGSYRKQGELIPGRFLFLFSSTKYSNTICSRLMNTIKVLLSPFHMIDVVAYLLFFTQPDVLSEPISPYNDLTHI